MNILITGGAGYIGSHTAAACAKSGWRPVVFDNLSTGHREAVAFGPFIEGDLADRDLIARALREHSIDAVMHFAATSLVGESMAAPGPYFRNNVANLMNLIDAMRECGTGTIVFSSSCAIYGTPERMPITESTPQAPLSPYGESKRMAERMLHWHGLASGLAWCSLRYFNASGASLDGGLGERHEPETHLIPRAMRAALGRLPAKVDLFGTDYDTPDGTALRDYIHVDDLAAAHLAALRYLKAGRESDAFNLGAGAGYSVRKVIETIERISGRTVPVRECPRRAGDAAVLIADASKAAAAFGWKPRYSTLECIVETAWRWHSGQPVCPGETRQ